MSDRRSAVSVSRRGILAASGAALLGVAGGLAFGGSPAAAPAVAGGPPPLPVEEPGSAQLPFFGRHQSGVVSPPALVESFVGFNLRARDRDSAQGVLMLLTDDASRLTQGVPSLADTAPELAVLPSGLTVTVGLGRAFFKAAGVPAPVQLREIPAFSTDKLSDRWGQTDFVVQIGSDDPTVVSHALRVVSNALSTLAEVAWVQDGFRPAVHANPGSSSYRTLFGQVDGTVNPGPEDFDEVVWVGDGPDYAVGGTVLVLRRIRLLFDKWDRLDRRDMERSIGRHLDSGAPLGKSRETDPMPFDEVDGDGFPVIPLDAHVRVAHAAEKSGQIFRRGFNYDDGFVDGVYDAGLLFAAYMRDPKTSFIPMQERISAHDAFNEWSVAVGSATYFILPGAAEGGFLGEAMFQ